MAGVSPMISVDEYIGIPYELGGCDRDGLDCWGLVRLVYKEKIGQTLPDFGSPTIEAGDVQLAIQAGLSYELSTTTNEPEDLDVVIARRRVLSHHAGIYVGGGVLHASSPAGSVVYEKLESFQNRIGGTVEFHRVKRIGV